MAASLRRHESRRSPPFEEEEAGHLDGRELQKTAGLKDEIPWFIFLLKQGVFIKIVVFGMPEAREL